MVHQHFKLIEVYSLLENIILGAEKTKNGFLDKKVARHEIQSICDQYHLPLNLDLKVERASVGEQQRVEIVKLLYRHSEILIFDEPTAVLSDDEIDGFLKMLLEFKKQGKTIILITHKLNEVKAVADRATVLRLGKVVKTFDVKNTSVNEIAECMIGKQMVDTKCQQFEDKPDAMTILSINNLVTAKQSNNKIDAIKKISLNVRAGEILGVAGIEGNGQSELALAICGLQKIKSGTINYFYDLNDRKKFIDIDASNVSDLYRHGISHIPEDRHKYGIILDDTVAMNAVLQDIDREPFSKHGIINYKNVRNYAKRLCIDYDVRGSNRAKASMRALSGGNQQKFVVGREITRPHKLLVCVQPTRGLDMGAAKYIHDRIIEDAKNGAAVILVSYELDEIFAVSNRVIVMDNGKIVFDAKTCDTSRKELGTYLSRTAAKIDSPEKVKQKIELVTSKEVMAHA